MRDVPVKDLTVEQATRELEELASAITKHDELYYNKAAPIVSDTEYDQLRRRHTEIERHFPSLRRADSPSLRVGTKPEEGYVKVRHTVPMLSLTNAFSEQEVQDFLVRLRRFLHFSLEESLDLVAELKIDGVSLSLSYTYGQLTLAATRGDGVHGEDITKNAVFIQGIPQELSETSLASFEVRGEVYMTRATFEELNVQRQQQGLSLFSNPRNATTGILRQLKASPTYLSRLHFVVHSLGYLSDSLGQTYTQVREVLKTRGGLTLIEGVLCRDYWELLRYYRDVESCRDGFGFDIDGVVYKVDDLGLRKRLGVLSRAPRWALAHKFTPNEARTILRDISIQVGRTGVLTPVARLEPVVINGVVVTRATLHNEEEVKRKDLRIGDSVIVQRSGDVIPKIKEVIFSERLLGSEVYSFPEFCPECGSRTFREEGKVIRYCSGRTICPAQIKQSFYHFVSRQAFDITGLARKTIDFLYDLGLLRSLSDVFHLRERDQSSTRPLSEYKGWGERSVSNLFRVIDSRRCITFSRFLFALGIRHIGEETSRVLAREYGSMVHLRRRLWEAMDSESLAYQGFVLHIGRCATESLREFFSEGRNLGVIDDLLCSVEIVYTEGVSEGVVQSGDGGVLLRGSSVLPLQGKRIVFTGKLSDMTREEAQVQAIRLGAEVGKTISRHTDLVIVGKNAGLKVIKAQALQIEILEEEAWQELLMNNF